MTLVGVKIGPGTWGLKLFRKTETLQEVRGTPEMLLGLELLLRRRF